MRFSDCASPELQTAFACATGTVVDNIRSVTGRRRVTEGNLRSKASMLAEVCSIKPKYSKRYSRSVKLQLKWRTHLRSLFLPKASSVAGDHLLGASGNLTVQAVN